MVRVRKRKPGTGPRVRVRPKKEPARWTRAWAERELHGCRQLVIKYAGPEGKGKEHFWGYYRDTVIPQLERFLKTGEKPEGYV